MYYVDRGAYRPNNKSARNTHALVIMAYSRRAREHPKTRPKAQSTYGSMGHTHYEGLFAPYGQL